MNPKRALDNYNLSPLWMGIVLSISIFKSPCVSSKPKSKDDPCLWTSSWLAWFKFCGGRSMVDDIVVVVSAVIGAQGRCSASRSCALLLVGELIPVRWMLSMPWSHLLCLRGCSGCGGLSYGKELSDVSPVWWALTFLRIARAMKGMLMHSKPPTGS